MPLGVQALLPFIVLLAAAALTGLRPRRPENGWIAIAGAAGGAAITFLELIRLAPGERVDVPFLTTFPYADLAIRLDALSLAFGCVTLGTAALLMLARTRMSGDRRDPWASWLLTSLATLSVIMAHNLLLVYIALQVLTLAWTGALDGTARRRRTLRLAIQVADIGLLLAAASAIQSVGTSAFSGVPSDTFGPAAFGLAVLPVLVRVAALTWSVQGALAPVAFEPAIAWAAPAGYLLLRLLALLGGHLPGRPVEGVLFGGALAIGAAAALLALWQRPGLRLAALLLVTQAAVGLALVAGSAPLMIVGSTWLWLQLIPLAALASVRVPAHSAAGAATLVSLGMVPGSAAFVAAFVGALGLRDNGVPLAVVPLAAVVSLAAVAALTRVAAPDRLVADVSTGWGLSLLIPAAFPILVLQPLVLPAAGTVRTVVAGTLDPGFAGFTADQRFWPSLLLSVLAAGLLLIASRRLRGRLPLGSPGAQPRIPRRHLPTPAVSLSARWVSRGLWTAFIVVALLAVLRP
ncbi:MAG TPA: hypothetical protein VIN39_03125 [Candidatus Dormibacteraeota bacterium]